MSSSLPDELNTIKAAIAGELFKEVKK